MIGQKELIQKIKAQLKEGTLPSFIIFVGARGCGKKLLVSELFGECVNIEPKVDAVRDMITMAIKMANRTFLIADADGMSLAAQNAMLKVVEECKNNNRFILTIEDVNNVLPTIQSRGTVFMFKPYARPELLEYLSMAKWQEDDKYIGADVCENVGELQTLAMYGVTKFYDYVVKVYKNIASVSGANAFKIGDAIDFKGDAEKYDLKLFLRGFRRVCLEKVVLQEYELYDKEQLINAVIITTKYISQLRVKGINKQSLFDAWLLDIRKEWM